VPVPRRAVLRIAIIGVVSAVVVALAGWVAQRARLGATEADGQARVEQDVRESFDVMVRGLSAMADAVAQPERVRAAASDEIVAARELFAAARQAVGVDGAVTVYDVDTTPLAWAGRPSELAAEILSGSERWLLASGGPGRRLAYVRPVMDGSTRIGSIVAEQLIGASDTAFSGVPGPRRARVLPFTLTTSLAPVSIRPASDAAVPPAAAYTFSIDAPSGAPLVSVSVTAADLAATRQQWRRTTWSVVLFVLAATCLLLAGPLLDWRNRAAAPVAYVEATVMTAAVIVLARAILRLSSPADWSDSTLFSSAAYASPLFRPLLSSPFDFLATAAAAGGLIGLLLFASERWRLHSWRTRRWVTTPARRATYLLAQAAAGAAVAAIVVGHRELLRNTIANTRLDLLDFSLHEWDVSRLALQVGLIVGHASAIGLGVTTLRAAQVGWRVPRGQWHLRAMAIACWSLPLVLWRFGVGAVATLLPLVVALTVTILLAVFATRLVARFRHGSQAFRLTLLTLGLVAPAFAFYPAIFQLAWDAKSQLVETGYAPDARNQLDNVQAQLRQSEMQIDQLPNLEALVTTPRGEDETIADRAFQVWQASALGNPLRGAPVTSSIEIYGPDERLVSRFAFNLSEEPTTAPLPPETQCVWNEYAVNLPFFAEERTIIHAGRALCGSAAPGPPLGSIVIHVLPNDYENLEFIASRNPYVELLRAPERARGERLAERDVEYAVYGWSRTPMYASAGPAWPLTDEVFARVVASRDPAWVELRRGSDAFDVYLTNDRFGIYALGFPAVSPLDHLVNLAELTVLAAMTFLLLLMGNAAFGLSARRAATGPALLREIRASFYRKLFIAFVAAVFLPVVALAIVTRIYFADRIRTSIEREAVETAETAGRVVADLSALDDNLMVWVSRLIDHDVNLFSEGQLLATSERNLFASGLLPTRTPAEIHDALLLRREAAIVTRERIGSLPEYLVAGTPLLGDIVLTVPLTARQQQIEDEIATLDGRVLLGALLFMLAGAGLGYSMAERISDPVNRLTRATRRIARGDLDARIAATSSDELRRLVEDFNTMARDLKRQRAELERTNRLEAWAEMARQVAHEIKNPLTPIQLNAEHLRRVHADRGQPLGPILAECVETILAQVKLLRQIASEFSSFASSPTARPSSVDVPELLHEIVDPYRIGLAERIRFEMDVPDQLPPVHVDRSLISRSLTNIVENALHAMPGDGTLSVMAREENRHVRIRVSDTGAGMDAEALARAFEPYFSTKASGTGLGLPIAKRNVELMGGTIAVTSERDRGTAVELTLPLADGS
jgi:signal transduction histidine kinase